MTFNAYWLPGLPEDMPRVAYDLPGGATIRCPLLGASEIHALCRGLKEEGNRVRYLSLQERIEAIDRAAAHLVDPQGALYHLAMEWLPAVTGYSPEMTRLVLLKMAQDWSRPALLRLVESEFGDPALLDGFARESHGDRQLTALGPDLAAHIFAGNVPGVAVTSLIRALLVKSPSFGKTAADEPVLPVLFALALATVHPILARTLALSYWPGGTQEPESALLDEADTVIVYGGAEAVSSITQRIRPTSRLVVHGPRISFGIVGQAALTPEQLNVTASEIAEAVAIFDQQGCVSPHLIYVIGSHADADNLARALAEALAIIEQRLPRGRLSQAEAVAIHEARAHAEFRAIAGMNVALYASTNTSYTVVLDPDAAFETSCLNRFIRIKPLPDRRRLTELLQPARHYLQSVAIAGFSDDEAEQLAMQLARLGVSRITSFARLPWPLADWHHDGGQPLRELVRWVDLEARTEVQ